MTNIEKVKSVWINNIEKMDVIDLALSVCCAECPFHGKCLELEKEDCEDFCVKVFIKHGNEEYKDGKN